MIPTLELLGEYYASAGLTPAEAAVREAKLEDHLTARQWGWIAETAAQDAERERQGPDYPLLDGPSTPKASPAAHDPSLPATHRERTARGDDPLLEVPPPVYFEALTGAEVPEHGGIIRCPLPGHEDRHPSCRVYAEPERGWYCWSENRGGTVYDLAAALWGHQTRGEDFNRLRLALLEELAA